MTKTEIINDTVNYYSKDPKKLRSLDDDNKCVYNSLDGSTHCAVGRFFKEEFKKKGPSLEGNSATLYGVATVNETNNLDGLLEEKVRGYDTSFWSQLQFLHDRSYYWSETGLSEKGRNYVEDLLNTYRN